MEPKYQVTKNIFYNFLGQFILLLISLISTPFIIHSLGNDLYGIYAILTVVVGYFAILDLGLGTSVIKFISEYRAKNDKQALKKIIGTALSAYIIIGLLGGLLIILLSKTIVTQFLHIPAQFIPIAISAFYLSGLGFFITMILTVFNAIPNGLQRMDITNSRNVLFGILNTLGIVGLLFFGQGLTAIIIWNISVSFLATLVFILVILKLLPDISLKPDFDLIIMKKLLKFGGFKFVGNVSGQIVFQLDRLLIGIFNPISAVTFYTAPLQIVQKVFSALLNVTNAAFPAISQSHGLDDQIRVKTLYIRMTRLIIFLVAPVLALLFIYSEQILSLYLGVEFGEKSSQILKVLAIAYFFIAVSASAVIVCDGVGKPNIPSFFSIISALINLSLAIILIPRFGAVGAAWALLINGLFQVPVFVYVVNKNVIKISNLDFLYQAYFRVLTSLLLTVILLLLALPFLGQGLVAIIYGIITFTFIYLLLNIILKTFSIEDKQAFLFLATKLKIIK